MPRSCRIVYEQLVRKNDDERTNTETNGNQPHIVGDTERTERRRRQAVESESNRTDVRKVYEGNAEEERRKIRKEEPERKRKRQMNVVAIIFLIIVTILTLFVNIIGPMIFKKREDEGSEDFEKMEVNAERCKECKHCKMLYDDYYIVCERLDDKAPTRVPDVCYRYYSRELPEIPFEELEATKVFTDED